MHKIQLTITHMQSSYNYSIHTSLSADFCSTPLQHLLLICCYPYLTTQLLSITSHRLFLWISMNHFFSRIICFISYVSYKSLFLAQKIQSFIQHLKLVHSTNSPPKTGDSLRNASKDYNSHWTFSANRFLFQVIFR